MPSSSTRSDLDSWGFDYPPHPKDEHLRKALALMAMGKLGGFCEMPGDLDFTRHVLLSAGSLKASLPRGSLTMNIAREDDEGWPLGEPDPMPERSECSLRMFKIEAPSMRVALACAVWEAEPELPPAFDWALWRSDQPGSKPFLRLGDWSDARLLTSCVMAAALPHQGALAHFAKAEACDALGTALCQKGLDLHRRAKAQIEARELAVATARAHHQKTARL